MDMVQTIILAIVIYQGIGLLLLILISTVSPSNDDDFCEMWAVGIWILPFLITSAAIKGIKRLYRRIFGFSIIRRKADEGGEYPLQLCKSRDLHEFEESEDYDLIRRYPKYKETKAGYRMENGVILGYDLQYISEKELAQVKNEESCYHCVHNGKECTEDYDLCFGRDYCYSKKKEYKCFERRQE